MKNFPKIMGVINVTPDSFSDGGLFFTKEHAIEHGIKLVRDGADIIDIGGESTRPGSITVPEDEEFQRVIPVIEGLKKELPDIVISIDTTKFIIALAALDAGATIINDISGLTVEPALMKLAAEKNAGLIIMHSQGLPRTMQLNPQYDDVVNDVYNDLKNKIEMARKAGVQNIMADVGIGFGKTVEHNLELLRNHKKFLELGVPMVLGISRKRFIGRLLNIENPIERDIPTTLLHALLINFGAEIIRIHNVGMLGQLKRLYDAVFQYKYY